MKASGVESGVFLGLCCSLREAQAKANLSFRVGEEFCGCVPSYNCFYYNPRKCDCLHLMRICLDLSNPKGHMI